MKVSGFSHITINVNDLAVALSFYGDLLGMTVVHRAEHDAYLTWGAAWICVQEGTVPPGRGGVDHVAFHLPLEDFDAAVKLLRDAGVPIVRGPVQRGLGWSINFLDPDGTQLELHTSTLEERMTVWTYFQ